MYFVFDKSSNNALDKFNEFTLNKELHKDYEAKL